MSVVGLAQLQLIAYNRADLEAFCACYHPEVTVLDAEGQVSLQGQVAFRARYGEMFATHVEVKAEVTERMVLEPHVIERERWSRVERATGLHRGGWVLVRYSEADGLIRWVQFLAPA
jgi:hypothetical protein